MSARMTNPKNAPTKEVCAVAVGMPNEVVELVVAFVQATLEDMLKLLSNVRSEHWNRARKLEIAYRL